MKNQFMFIDHTSFFKMYMTITRLNSIDINNLILIEAL